MFDNVLMQSEVLEDSPFILDFGYILAKGVF